MSEFWVRKIETYFSKIDINNDGVVSLKEAEEMAGHLADVENCSPEKKEQIINIFAEIWRKCMKSAGSDDNGLLTASIMVASIEQQMNDPALKESFDKMFHTMFSFRDVNGDGYLSLDEYTRLFTGIGVQDPSFIRSAFEHIDLNQDEKLSLDKYACALWKYIATEDEHLLWGPLV